MLLLVVLVGLLSCVTFNHSFAGGEFSAWSRFHGSYGTYSMSDLNSEIDELNPTISPNLDKAESGVGLGAYVGMAIGRRSRIGFAFERLTSGDDVLTSGGRVGYRLPANMLRLHLEFVDGPEGLPFRVGFGLGMGVVWTKGKVFYADPANEDPGRASRGKWEGMDLAAEGYFIAESRPAGGASLFAAVGFRRAKIVETEIDKRIVYTEDGENYALDYGGMILRFGVTLVGTPK